MIVDPTVIQLKNSLQSYCIIKISPDYIKLCWNRPQLLALLKQLLQSSSRRYIWVSGRYILGFIFVSHTNVGGKHCVLPRVLGGSWKSIILQNQKSSFQEKKTWDLRLWFLQEGCKKKEIQICWVLLSAERGGTAYRTGWSGGLLRRVCQDGLLPAYGSSLVNCEKFCKLVVKK